MVCHCAWTTDRTQSSGSLPRGWRRTPPPAPSSPAVRHILTAYNSNIVPQVSSSGEIVDMVAIFNDVVLAARGGTISRAGTSGSWTSIVTGKSTTYRYDFERYNYNGTEKIMIATGADAAFSIDTSYNVDVINATGGGTAPTNPKYVASYKNHMFYQ